MTAGAVAGAFLTEDNAAFAVDGAVGQQQVTGGFAHQEQAGIEIVVGHLGQVEFIDGLAETGVGVGIGAEGQAVTFENLDHLAFGHIFRAIEGHVFEEVGEALLRIVFHQRTAIEAQTDRGSARRRGVFQDDICHAVRQLAEAHRRISLDVGMVLGEIQPFTDVDRLANGSHSHRGLGIAMEWRQGRGGQGCDSKSGQQGCLHQHRCRSG